MTLKFGIFILLIVLISGKYIKNFHKHSMSDEHFLTENEQYQVQNQENIDDNDIFDANCNDIGVIPGVKNSIGSSINIITFQNKQQLFKFKCDKKQYNWDGTKRVPDGLKSSPIYRMDFQNTVKQASTLEELEKIKLNALFTEVQYNADFPQQKEQIVAEKDSSILSIKQQIEKGNKYLQVSTSYQVNQLELIDYSQIQISDELVQDLMALPQDYDKRLYGQFIDKWGTHYREQVILGGRVKQRGYATPACTLDTEQLEQNFNNYFTQEIQDMHLSRNNLDESMVNQSVDSDFTNNVNLDTITISGGNVYNNDLTGWVKEVQKSPVTTFQKLIPLKDLYDQIIKNPSMLPPGIPHVNLPTVFGHIGTATQGQETVRKGCQIKSAVNYDKEAIIEDNSKCKFTIFYGSYQTVVGDQCSPTILEKFPLKNEITKGLSCQPGTEDKIISHYTGTFFY